MVAFIPNDSESQSKFRSLSNPEPAAATTTSSGVLHSLVCRDLSRAAASRSATPSGRAGGNGLYSLARAP